MSTGGEHIMNALINGTLALIAFAALVPSARAVGAQAAPGADVDFTNAVLAEVKNAQGQVILSGRFAVAEEEDDDVERKAKLTATAIDPDAKGEAEVEVSGAGKDRRQEVEFTVSNVQPGAAFTLLIDGKVVATVTADDKGRAAHEREGPLVAATSTPPE
jgi:hypothetical protein